MDFQALCELADRELKVGLGEETLVRRALAEANGVEAHARQICWHLRAEQLQDELRDEDGQTRVRELQLEIEEREKRLRSRKESYRWMWAIVCFAGLIGSALFPVIALRAVGKAGPAFHVFLGLSVASLARSIAAYTASRYHTHTE